ncbi:MAG: hypothetical protein FJ335_03765 [Sphingomonadales bacterium]|nr:hypothetical protein [Sphingomonadales bacterium]
MIAPADVDLRAYRGVPFVDVTAVEGVDYGTASFTLELRFYRDAPDALVSLSRIENPSAQGVTVIVTLDDDLPTSAIQIRINETTLEAIRKTSPAGGDIHMVYALDATGAGVGKHRLMRGEFILEASANG